MSYEIFKIHCSPPDKQKTELTRSLPLKAFCFSDEQCEHYTDIWNLCKLLLGLPILDSTRNKKGPV